MAPRYVNLSQSTSAISGTQAYHLRLNFPDTGGVQAVDVAGTVYNLVSGTGSLIPSTDNVSDLGSAALRWRTGYFGTSVVSPSVIAGTTGNATLSLVSAGTGAVNLVSPAGATVLGMQNVSSTFFGLAVENAAASTTGGAVAIHAVSGRFRILAGAGAAPIIITDNRVLDANSIVIPVIRTLDTTLLQVIAIAAPGQFTVTANANATANVDIDFIVINRAV